MVISSRVADSESTDLFHKPINAIVELEVEANIIENEKKIGSLDVDTKDYLSFSLGFVDHMQRFNHDFLSWFQFH
jgi:hypothetical protein